MDLERCHGRSERGDAILLQVDWLLGWPTHPSIHPSTRRSGACGTDKPWSQVGRIGGVSEVFSFRTAPEVGSVYPEKSALTIGVIGDEGVQNSGRTMNHMNREVEDKYESRWLCFVVRAFSPLPPESEANGMEWHAIAWLSRRSMDMVVHVGDISYADDYSVPNVAIWDVHAPQGDPGGERAVHDMPRQGGGRGKEKRNQNIL